MVCGQSLTGGLRMNPYEVLGVSRNADIEEIKSESKYIINNIIHEYGALASWKLSALTHREISWLNSRKGLKKEENGRVKIKNEDIQEDAKKVRPYDYAWDMYYDEFEDYEAVV